MRRQVAFLFSGGVFIVSFAVLIAASRWLAGVPAAPIAASPHKTPVILATRRRELVHSRR
jgi:hypothetical protein